MSIRTATPLAHSLQRAQQRISLVRAVACYMTGATAATDCCNGLLQQLRETRYMTRETRYVTGATAAADGCNRLLQQLRETRVLHSLQPAN